MGMYLRAGNGEISTCFILACSYFALDSSWIFNYLHLSQLLSVVSIIQQSDCLTAPLFLILKCFLKNLGAIFIHFCTVLLIDLTTTLKGKQSSQSLLFACFLYVCGFVSSCPQQHVVFWEAAWAVKVFFHPRPLSALKALMEVDLFSSVINWRLIRLTRASLPKT